MRPEFVPMHVVAESDTIFLENLSSCVEIIYRFLRILEIETSGFMGYPGSHHVPGAKDFGAIRYGLWILHELFITRSRRWDTDTSLFTHFSEFFRRHFSTTAF